MLREIEKVRQISGEPRRRWFDGEDMDLTVWEDVDGEITGFQLCYDGPVSEHALTWKKGLGYIHNRVDDGEAGPGQYKETPILLSDGKLDIESIQKVFNEGCDGIDEDIAVFVTEKLEQLMV